MEIYNLYIDQPIGNFKGEISNSYVRDELEKATKQGADTVRLIINSPGGLVYEGFAIYNTLVQSGFKITAHIYGLCASIATLIASAASTIEMSENAQWMIHEAKGGAEGKAEDLESTAKAMRQINSIIAKNYSKKTGKSIEEIEKAMSFDNYMTPQQAKEFGFVDSITLPIAAYGSFQPINVNDKQKNTMSGITKDITDAFAKLQKLLTNNATAVIAGSEPLADGNTILYFDGDLATGKAVFIDESMTTPASEGEHALANGKIVIVDSAGIIVEIREVEASADLTEALEQVAALTEQLEASQKEITDLKAAQAKQLSEITTQIAALKGQITNSGTKIKKAVPEEAQTGKTSVGLNLQAKHIKQKFGIK
jgi:ATP-dependent Clp endopeptidase proteolytic subunit ClpP